jgi:hypothetical protein
MLAFAGPAVTLETSTIVLSWIIFAFVIGGPPFSRHSFTEQKFSGRVARVSAFSANSSILPDHQTLRKIF